MNRSDRLILAAILMVILVQLVICNCLFFGPMVTLTLLPVTVLFIPLKHSIAWTIIKT